MTNAFLTPDVIAKQALASLHESTIMRNLVYTDLSQEFAGAKIGDTVNIRKPAVFEAKMFDRSNGIEIQDVNEDRIPVKVDKIPDVSVTVTNEELTLDIESFDDQIITPAMQAIAEHIDKAILGLRADVTQAVGQRDGFLWDKPEALIDAGRALNMKKVPARDRAAVIGPDMNAQWLNTDVLKQANTSGSTEALRDAYLGRKLFGFDPYWTTGVETPVGPETGQPTTEVGVAFHKSAFGFVSVPMQIPPGAMGSVQQHDGLSIRMVYQNDINKKQTILSFDCLYGVKTIDPDRAVLIKGEDAE